MKYRMMRNSSVLAIAATLSLATAAGAVDAPLPWAFNGERAEGYSIDLVTVDPSPGTALAAGSKVNVKITVSYSMTIAPHGGIALVAQDDRDRPAAPGAAPPYVEVNSRTGQVSLSQTILVPRNAKELRVFVPLMPDGLKITKGEVTIRYPIESEK